MLNGDGLRVVLWVAGCDHGCKECQNPSTWNPEGGLPFTEKVKTEVFAALAKSYISGITLSGGDPLYSENVEAILQLVLEIKERFKDKTIWLYTGSLWEEIREMEVIQHIDVVIDGEYECNNKQTSLRWRGSTNQRVIDVKESLVLGKTVLHCE